MTESFKRRENVHPEEERQGIVHRISAVEVGQDFGLRKGTDDLTFDFERGITWSQLTQNLVSLGIVKPSEEVEGSYTVLAPLSSVVAVAEQVEGSRRETLALLGELVVGPPGLEPGTNRL